MSESNGVGFSFASVSGAYESAKASLEATWKNTSRMGACLTDRAAEAVSEVKHGNFSAAFGIAEHPRCPSLFPPKMADLLDAPDRRSLDAGKAAPSEPMSWSAETKFGAVAVWATPPQFRGEFY